MCRGVNPPAVFLLTSIVETANSALTAAAWPLLTAHPRELIHRSFLYSRLAASLISLFITSGLPAMAARCKYVFPSELRTLSNSKVGAANSFLTISAWHLLIAIAKGVNSLCRGHRSLCAGQRPFVSLFTVSVLV